MLPQVSVAAQHISNEQVPDADSRQESWQELMQAPIDLRPDHSTSFVVIADPTFHRVTDLLAGLDYAYPEAAKIGGFVSSATQTAKRALFCWSAGSKQSGSEDGIVKVWLRPAKLTLCISIASANSCNLKHMAFKADVDNHRQGSTLIAEPSCHCSVHTSLSSLELL